MEMKLVPFDSDLWDIYTGAYGSVRTEVKILMGHKKTAPPSGTGTSGLPETTGLV